MTDLERLEEALAQHRDGEASVHQYDDLAIAARSWLRWGPAVEAAEEVWWCDVHRRTAPPMAADKDNCRSADNTPCSMEPVLVVRRRLLAEET